MGYKEIDKEDIKFFIPNDLPDSEVSVLVFYPGESVNGINPGKFLYDRLKDVISDWFEKYVIVIPKLRTSPWQEVKTQYEMELSMNNLNIENVNLFLYSSSGSNSSDITYRIESIDKLSSLSLIDPESGSNLEQVCNNINVVKYLSYNLNNWKGKQPVLDSYSNLPNVVGTANVYKDNSDIYNHDRMVEIFFDNFKSKIEKILVSELKNNNDEVIETNRKEKIEGIITLNVETRDVFIPVSSRTIPSEKLKGMGRMELTNEFVFQDDNSEQYLDDIYKEQEFSGEEEPEDSEIQLDIQNYSDNFEKQTKYTPSGEYDLDIIPGEYLDNNKNPIKLCRIDSSLVNIKIAEQYLRMRDAAKADGINLYVSSGFRSPFDGISTTSSKGNKVFASSQDYLYTSYIKQKEGLSSYVYNGTDNVRKGKTIKLGTFNLAARPGRSNHGSGIGLDLNAGGNSRRRFSNVNKEVYIWLVKNSWKFGFIRSVAREEWHFDYLPELAKLGPYGKLGNGVAQKDTGGIRTKFYKNWGLDSLQGPDWGSTIQIA
jgi:LAS superfamily LD-carboxypeptidase LdcB